jgi:hypothetical protein
MAVDLEQSVEVTKCLENTHIVLMVTKIVSQKNNTNILDHS